MTADDPLRIVIFDQAASTNPYSWGLAEGLEHLGATAVVAGPARSRHASVVAVYPRGGTRDQKLGKLMDSIGGLGRLTRLAANQRPDVVHFQWATLYNYLVARTLKSVMGAR